MQEKSDKSAVERLAVLQNPEKPKSIIETAIDSMRKMHDLFQLARYSGLYKYRKTYGLTDKELKEMLDQGDVDMQAVWGKLLIAEHVMQEFDRASKMQYSKATAWDDYQEQVASLQAVLISSSVTVKKG